MDTTEFVNVWQNSSSAIEVANHFGVTPVAARAKAAYLRKAHKIELKDMRVEPKFDVECLRQLAKVA